MGMGCLLTGKAEFFKEGDLFDAMKDKCAFTNRVWSLHRKRANRRFNKKTNSSDKCRRRAACRRSFFAFGLHGEGPFFL